MRGFSIVETLAALVVLSLGMLGIAALYVHSLGHQRTAIHRTQAAYLAADLAEHIRANRSAGAAYAFAAGDATVFEHCVTAAAGCTATGLARDDLARWLVAIHDTLPGDGVRTPSGTVAVDITTVPARYTITVSWSEPGAAQPLSYVLDIEA